jgi:hypothetical protein
MWLALSLLYRTVYEVSPDTLQEVRKDIHYAKQTHLVDVPEALSRRDKMAISGVLTHATKYGSEVHIQ